MQGDNRGILEFGSLYEMIEGMERAAQSMLSGEAGFFQQIQPTNSQFPKLNVEELDNRFVLEAAVAGFKKEDIELTFEQNCLIIEVWKRNDKGTPERKFLLKELSSRHYKRIVKFPKKVDPSKISSSYENGILRVILGIAERNKSNKTKIEIG